jgi:DNA-binding NarL/FixJ family response regulator
MRQQPSLRSTASSDARPTAHEAAPSASASRPANDARDHGRVRRTKPAVLIVHRVPLVTLGLRSIIESSRRYAVCAATSAAPYARELFVRYNPPFSIVGLTLCGGDGIELLKDFRRVNPGSRAIVLSTRSDAMSIERAFHAGARGYLMVDEHASEVVCALDHVAAGELYTTADIAARLSQNAGDGPAQAVDLELARLSDRELQVFRLIGRGFGASRVATELHISVKTFETHQLHIKEKLRLRDAPALQQRALRSAVHAMRQYLSQSRDAVCDVA